jgi:sodium-dependent dicarboxylate transporter 2/3/5
MKSSRAKTVGLSLGPLLFLVMLVLPVPEGMPAAAWRTAAVALWMVVWWICEAIPIPATSLLPLVAFPLLGIRSSPETAADYADHNVFLFMGGFIIALGMEKWGLHRRIALRTVQLLGTGMRTVVLAFMLASALLSMWISNTATTMMMLPIAMAVLSKFEGREGADRLGVALMLGIAWAASVGGIGTLIGTPPNIVLAGAVKKLLPGREEVGFGQWMRIGLPLVAAFVPLIWLYLVRIASPVPRESGSLDLRAELSALGPMSRGEKIALAVFLLTAAAWILRKPVLSLVFPGVTDATVAMTGALILFVIPVHWKEKKFAMDWKQAVKLPWGILLLFGGGFALAAAMEKSGLSAWLGDRLTVLSALPTPLVIAVTCAFMAALTELTSNTATTITMLPVLAATARGMGIDPLTLMVPATMAASCAFMLPVATPPNAIVFASGKVPLSKMFRSGIWMELVGVLLITLLMCTLGRWVFG